MHMGAKFKKRRRCRGYFFPKTVNDKDWYLIIFISLAIFWNKPNSYNNVSRPKKNPSCTREKPYKKIPSERLREESPSPIPIRRRNGKRQSESPVPRTFLPPLGGGGLEFRARARTSKCAVVSDCRWSQIAVSLRVFSFQWRSSCSLFSGLDGRFAVCAYFRQ